MSINFPPIQESLEEAVSNLNKLGCNLQTRCGNLRKKRLAAEKMRAPDGITKLCEKILVICDLSKKSIDNVEHSVRKAMGTYLDDRRKNFHSIDNQQIRISNDTNRNEDTPRNENSTISNPKAKNDDATIDVLESQRDSGLFYDFDNAVRIPNGVNISNYISCVVRIPFFEKNAVDSYKDHTFSTSKKKKKVAFVDKPIVINDHLDVTNTDQGNESSDLFASDDSLDKRVSSSESDTNEPNQSENYRHNKHALEIGKKIKCDEKELRKSSRTGLGDVSLFRTSKEICLEKGVQYEKKNKSDSKKPYRSNSVEESIENNGLLIEKQVGNDNSKSSNSRSSNEIVQSDDDCSTVATKERNENYDDTLADSNQNTSNDLKKDLKKNENEGTHLEKQITVGIGNEINISSEVSNTLEDRVNAKLIEDHVIMGVSREQKKSTKEVEVNTAKLIGDNVLHGISSNVETSTKESEVNAKIIEGDIVRTVVIEHKTSTNENNEEKTDGLGIESNKPDISRDNEVVDLDPKKLGENIRLSPLSEHKTYTNENNEEKTDGLRIENNKLDISRDNEVVDLDPKKLGENIRLSPLSDHEICNKSPIILNIASDDSNLLTPVKTEPKSIIRCINIAKLLASPKQKPPEEVIDLDLIDTPSPAEKNKKKINCSRLNVGKARKQLLKSKPHTDEPSVVSKKPEELALDELHKKIKSDIENNRCVARVRLNRMGSLQSLLLRHNLTKITKYCKTIIKRSVSKVDDSARRSLLHNSTSEDENSQPDKASADDSDSDNSIFLLKPRKLKLKRKDRKSTISDDSCDSDDNEMGRSMRLKSRSADSKNNSDSSGSNKEKSIDAAVDRLTNLKDLGKTEQKKATDNSSDSAHEKAKKVKTNKEDKSPKHVENGLDDEIENDSSNDNIDQRTESPSCNATNGKNEAEELAKCDLLDSNDTDDTDKNAGQKKTTEKESHCLKSSSKSKGKKKPVDKLLSGKLSETESSEDPKKSKSDSVKDSTESSDDCNLRSKKRCKTVLKSDSDNDSGSKKNHKSGSQSDDSHKENESDKKSESDNSSDDFKTGKRKKKIRSSDDSDSDITKGKKKRRRIKNSDDSDEKSNGENSDDDSGDEGAKRGRKNIRRVMRRDDLGEATIRAEKEERLRRQRIADRQKQYNSVMFDESGKPEEAVVEKVVLDFDPETKEPIIEVDKGLVKKLKPHQANGVKFMWDASYESVKQIEKRKGSGCILAHCMGLGKTLQVISLIHTLLSYPEQTKTRRVLVVCPLSTVLNWVNEFKMWLEHADGNDDIAIYELSRYKQNFERAYQLQEWLEEGGVCVLGYEMFRNLSADNTKKYRKKMLKTFQESLVDPGPDLVVCDEGHLLKNEKTSLSQSMNRIKTRRRIVLTGTPLQNNLKEYYCMVQFVKPNLLGKYNEYLNRFVNPITNGQYTNSTEYDIRIMKRRSHVLHKLLDGAVQRRDYAVLAPFLPPKQEYVFFITVTDIQTKLYQYYLDNYSRRPRPDRKNSGFLFPDFQSLQRIWTHPLVLKANSARYELMQQKKRDKEEDEDSEGSLINFIDDDESDTETSAKSTSDNSSNESSNDSDDSTKRSKNKKKKKSGNVSDSSDKKDKKSNSKGARATRSTRANPVSPNPDETIDDIVEVKSDNPTEWWIPLVADVDLENMALSNKLVLLFEILRQCEAIGDKVLVFSQSLYSLDLIEHFLSKIDEATQAGTVTENLCGHIGSWSQGLDYFRLDGQTSCENRSIWCKSFNREDNPRARLFLISTRAGGLGINLVAANRVIIFDVSWNPSHDVQSIFRIYRFGQKKPCYIYRFLAMGTMEEKIYERQVTKQAISKRVIDEQQIDRHYAENDLQELYTFTPVPEESRPVPPLPKDRLFAEMLKKYETLIYKYHEHDSLLENKEEETLTEEERKAAWEDFENEKNKPPPPPPGMMGNMMPNMNFGWNGLAGNSSLMINNVLGRIRSENPNMTAAELNAMIPTIMSGLFPQSNLPTLQNKMASLLNAYPQGRIANPMMAGLGGVNSFGPAGNMTSEQAAAYSSWQYQQLQNLQRMQQQAPGMKYYAGGLGSRDPISMAEAQKRQRDMIISGMSDAIPRRGRPPTLMPKMPLGPPNRPGDVVNLDDSE